MEEEDDEDSEVEEEPKKNPFFNFAESSLKRIDFVLLQLGAIAASFEISEETKQRKKIALLKMLLQYAMPLAPELKSLKDEIFSLRIEKVIGVNYGNQRLTEPYSDDLELKLDNYLNKICMALQSYFMPRVEEDDEDDY